MSKKGSASERELAVMLSEWWTNGARDDVFWRVLGSGSRAKSRGRKGLDTYGSAGDITAVDPIGAPLLELFTIEDKKGYPTTAANPFEAIDRIKPLVPNKANFDGWIKQVEESSAQAKTPYWMITFCRYRRRRMVCFPQSVIREDGYCLFTEDDCYLITSAVTARFTIEVEGVRKYLAFAPLDELLQFLTPDMVIEANKRRKK